MELFWAILLGLGAVAGWLLNVAGLPGNWVIVGGATMYAFLMPVDLRVSFGWPVVALLLVLALFGELVEFVAAAAGATKAGSSWRGAVLALAGGIVGGIVGAIGFLPIPVLGPIVGALLFASAGALIGAMIGENWAGRTWQHSWQVGQAAFWGRLFGTLGKMLVGSIMVAVVLVALAV